MTDLTLAKCTEINDPSDESSQRRPHFLSFSSDSTVKSCEKPPKSCALVRPIETSQVRDQLCRVLALLLEWQSTRRAYSRGEIHVAADLHCKCLLNYGCEALTQTGLLFLFPDRIPAVSQWGN